MTQLVVASTLFGAATAAAAVDAGLLGTPDGERVLLIVNNAPAPELTPALDEIEGADPVLRRFDRTVHLTDLIAPTHPSGWSPGQRERPAMERLLRKYWGLGDGPVDIVAESVWVNPAQALARIFHSSPVTVYADGLMSYGPTRSPLPLDVRQRLEGLLHLDLVPGLRPVLLSEYGIDPTVIPNESFRGIIEEIAAKSHPAPEGEQPPTALVVGQYLAALGLMTRSDETRLHERMISAAAKSGAKHVRFKPHPSAPPSLTAPLADAATAAGVTFEIIDDPLPAEVLLAGRPYVAMVGCFSTALVTARTVFGVPSVAVDTGRVLKLLTPYENSNRMPVTIIDALHRKDTPYTDPARLQELVGAVAYCMQPRAHEAHRDTTIEFLAGLSEGERRRYISDSRVGALRLPGAPRKSAVVEAATDAARAVLRHPALGWVDQQTQGSELRKKLARKVRG
ncbi:polysialyltransferase family glycosyltransferase [Promicromonospora sp. NPDC050249]|uniref:polysialyltransferase family glycosyltransferase n=1 Tax=Promicromonospora sp. NPDC050249 TaxID=3154743 RepID=UPI0033F07D05